MKGRKKWTETREIRRDRRIVKVNVKKKNGKKMREREMKGRSGGKRGR